MEGRTGLERRGMYKKGVRMEEMERGGGISWIRKEGKKNEVRRERKLKEGRGKMK